MHYVNDNEVEDIVKILEEEKEIAIDTEFIRDNYYVPVLCLVQIATRENIYILDPINYDISALKRVLTNPRIVKIFHSARQDMDVLFKTLDIIVAPIFDTQIAASILGLGDSISYKKLVRENFSVDIDKGPKLTDWSKRPLAKDQLKYASYDVAYLFQLRDKMRYLLGLKERISWVEEETAYLYDKTQYAENLDDIWSRVSTSSPVPYFLNYLREFASVREEIAIQNNKPRKYIISDDILITLARLKPKSKQDILGHRILANKIHSKYIDLFVAAAEKVDEKKDEELIAHKKTRLNIKEEIILELLKMLLKHQSVKHKVAIRIIATTEDLKEFVKHPEKSKLLKGWRKEVFGDIARSLVRGKLYIKVNVDMTLELISK